MWSSSGQETTGTPPTEESGPLAENTPLTGYEPNIPDDFHYSETTEIFFQEQSSDTVPSYLFDAELDDETIGRALSSPLFIQEREEPADRRQACHSFEESLLQAQSFSVCHSKTGRPAHELSSLSSCSKEKPSRDSENEPSSSSTEQNHPEYPLQEKGQSGGNESSKKKTVFSEEERSLT